MVHVASGFLSDRTVYSYTPFIYFSKPLPRGFRVSEKHPQIWKKKQLKKQQTKNVKLDLSFCADKALGEFVFPPSTGSLALLRWALSSAWRAEGQPLMQGYIEAASRGFQSPVRFSISLAGVQAPARTGTAAGLCACSSAALTVLASEHPTVSWTATRKVSLWSGEHRERQYVLSDLPHFLER